MTNTNADLNGIHLEPVRQATKAFTENHDLAKSRFQITNKWNSGGQNIRMDIKVKTAEENLNQLKTLAQFSPV